MKDLTDSRTTDDADQLWLLQHPRVFTQGQAGKAEHVLAPVIYRSSRWIAAAR